MLFSALVVETGLKSANFQSQKQANKGSFPLRAWKRAFFVSFIDLSALKIEARAKQSKKINKTKNNLFHACSGNGP